MQHSTLTCVANDLTNSHNMSQTVCMAMEDKGSSQRAVPSMSQRAEDFSNVVHCCFF